ncbi:MAG: hypothetical protein JJU02_10280 [Cryomorphaceae bacterium]|nr:hypothetical protein [Cryomorphaceae bacterium]
MKIKIVGLLISVFVIWIIVLSFQTYKYPNSNSIEKRLNYLERVIKQPLKPGSEIMDLETESHEFMLFTYAYTTYALANLSSSDDAYLDLSIELIRTSIARVLQPEIYTHYGIEDPTHLKQDYSILYLGHLNLMLGIYRMMTEDTTYNNLNDSISKSLVKRYNDSKFINLESYKSAIWIPDNSVAIASLKLHSYNDQNSNDSICEKWVKYVKANYVDKNTGTLFSTINPETGESLEEPRGSMLGWSMMFISQFDKEFALELYHNYKKHFSQNYLIYRLFRERHNDKTSSEGDIDSGPIIWGFSIPANAFALSNSIMAGDYKTAKKIERLINLGAKKITSENELKYKLRFGEMRISPMAEAYILYAITIADWPQN